MMSGMIEKTWRVLVSAGIFCMSITTQAALLQDGGFEAPLASTPWSLFGNASLETSPSTLIEGTQALKLDGNDGNAFGPFTVAFQFVALGTGFSVGDNIVLRGLYGHLANDLLIGGNQAFIEITFANAMTTGGTDFSTAVQSPFLTSGSATDTLLSTATPVATIPEKANGLDTEFIRIAAALWQQDPADEGAAWFDNLALSTVPEPSNMALLGIGLAGLGFVLRKKS